MMWYVADFETSVYEGQTETEVWCSGLLGEEGEPEVYNSINTFMNRCSFLENNTIVYFHNLKFDGAFIISYLLFNEYTPAIEQVNINGIITKKFKKKSKLKKKSSQLI